jgi:hypothetical protein
MERLCTHCHATLAPETQADWCPACGGSLIERQPLFAGTEPPSRTPPHAAPVVDHRGILLPPRHAVGGIITPQ